jgi:hypothetical protein
MRVTRLTISADRLRHIVADVTSSPLAQSDCRRAPIVEVLDGGSVEIVDGYHRIAGMIAAGETHIDCITCDNTDLIALAADPGRPERQRRALAAIYRAI